jgi:D-beta-D-heptose 7-phosphate kinase/D-beta-D-heptose 1-phosphate adenosyltransferase
VEWLSSNVGGFDGIFLSDYEKGLFTCPEVIQFLPDLYEGSVPVVAGPKPGNLDVFKGVHCLTLNAKEAAAATGLPVMDDSTAEAAGERLLEISSAQSVLITRGEQGMSFFKPGQAMQSEPAFATEVYDVSGAGDTVLTVVGLGLCAGLEGDVCIRLASHAAAVVVRKLGTATLTISEIAESLKQRT